MLSSCTVVESLCSYDPEVPRCALADQAPATKNISDTICRKPIRNRQEMVKGSSLGSLAIALLAYVIRIFSKVHLSIQSKVVFTDLWWDDLLITITVMAAIPYCTITTVSMSHVQSCPAAKQNADDFCSDTFWPVRCDRFLELGCC